MSPDQWEKVKGLFLEAIEQPSQLRQEFARQRSSGDEEVLAELQAMLAAHRDSAGADLDTRSTSAPGDTPPKTIGPYTLMQKIGEGGMGVVYMAEQTHPVRRRVALKIIKPGMDSAQVVARFEAERQALAMMDHANIARVYDAGTTDNGHPYFVMELVHGVPITEYCDQKHLIPRERLDLFLPVCQAVQHAHQKGIIHRDIKPSNVLVMMADGKPVPKVIDFGVAKALHQKLTEKTLFTQFGAVVGTLEYMSPEQTEMDMQGTDTRSDVYSLGVLLYELMTGTTPLDGKKLREIAYAEMLKVIREAEPQKPSNRLGASGNALASVCALRKTEPRKLVRLLCGDLDWIVMKCLEKDRDRRYVTVRGLSRDIEAYLSDEPVEASPPSATYKLAKFARKYRVPLRVACAFALLLIAATIISSWEAVRAKRAEGRIGQERDQVVAEKRRADEQTRAALEQAQIATAINNFLNNDVLGQASARIQSLSETADAPDPRLTVRAALDHAANRINTRFDNQPMVKAAILTTLGNAYLDLGEYASARQHVEAALQLSRQALGPEHPRTLGIMDLLAVVYSYGQTAKAELLVKQILEVRRRVSGAGPATLSTLDSLACVYRNEYRFDEAEALFLQTLEGWRRLPNNQQQGAGHTRYALAEMYLLQKKYAEAELVFQQELEQLRQSLGDQHLTTLLAARNLASVYVGEGRAGDAEPLLRNAVDVYQKTYGAEHPDTLSTIQQLAQNYLEQRQFAKAEPLWRELAEYCAAHPDGGNLHAALMPSRVLHNLIACYRALGQVDKAMMWEQKAPQTIEAALQLSRQARGPENLSTLFIVRDLGTLYSQQGQFAKAEPLWRELADYCTTHPDDGSPHGYLSPSGVLPQLIACYRGLGQVDTAAAWEQKLPQMLEGTLQLSRRVRGPEHPLTLNTIRDLGSLYSRQGQFAKAEPLWRELAEYCVAHRDGGNLLSDFSPSAVLSQLIACYRGLGQVDKAAAWEQKLRQELERNAALAQQRLEAALQSSRQARGPEHPDTLAIMSNLAGAYTTGQPAKAELLYQQVLEVRRRVLGATDPATLIIVRQLGALYSRQGQFANAEPLWRELAEYNAARPDGGIMLAGLYPSDVLSQLIACYRGLGQVDNAAAWEQKLPQALEAQAKSISKQLENPRGGADEASRLFNARGLLYQRAGRFPQAIADFSSYLKLKPEDHEIRYRMGCMQLYQDDEAAYRSTCVDLLRRTINTTDRSIADRTAKLCLLAPGAVQDLSAVMRLADLATAPGTQQYAHYYQLVKGLAEYRAGNFDAAADWLTRSRNLFVGIIARQDRNSLDRFAYAEGMAAANFYLAMAEHRRGHEPQAREALVLARHQLHANIPTMLSGSVKVGLEDWLIVQIAAKEAQTLIGPE